MNQVFIPRSVERNGTAHLLVAQTSVTVIHVLATGLGGALAGVIFASLGSALAPGGAPREGLSVLLLGAASYAAIMQVQGRTGVLPQRHCQVPRGWLLWRHRSHVAIAYGAMIGTGVLTKTRHATFYVLLGFYLLAPSPACAALLGGLYGLIRGGMVLVNWFYQSSKAGDLVGSAMTIELPAANRILTGIALLFPVWIVVDHQIR